jgi:hypothetical protein
MGPVLAGLLPGLVKFLFSLIRLVGTPDRYFQAGNTVINNFVPRTVVHYLIRCYLTDLINRAQK